MPAEPGYSLVDVQNKHKEEGEKFKGRVIFGEGSLPGDLTVEIIPPPNKMDVMNSRYYLYRRNPLNSRYTLIDKKL